MHLTLISCSVSMMNHVDEGHISKSISFSKWCILPNITLNHNHSCHLLQLVSCESQFNIPISWSYSEFSARHVLCATLITSRHAYYENVIKLFKIRAVNVDFTHWVMVIVLLQYNKPRLTEPLGGKAYGPVNLGAQ